MKLYDFTVEEHKTCTKNNAIYVRKYTTWSELGQKIVPN
jgi:hypothetical protein